MVQVCHAHRDVATAGVALLLIGESGRNDVRAVIGDPAGSPSSQRDLGEQWSAANTDSTVGYVLLGVGALSLATSAVLFATHAAAPKAKAVNVSGPGLRMSPLTFPRGGGVALGGGF